MNRASPGVLALAATGLLATATLVLLATSAIWVEPSFIFASSGAVVLFQIAAVRYRKQGERPLVAALDGASMLLVFTTLYAIAHYCLPEHSSRFYDTNLANFDAAVGLTADMVVRWSRSIPWVDRGLSKIYYAFFFHFALYVPYAAGVRRDWYRMYETLAAMFIAANLGLLMFGLWPAKNTVWFYGHADLHHTLGIVDHLQLLQDKEFGLLTTQRALGLIQFPSFHMAIAAILFWDLRYEPKVVFAFGFVWTFLMGVSAITTGGHYVVDVWAGLFVAGVGIGVVTLLERPRTDDELAPVPLWQGS